MSDKVDPHGSRSSKDVVEIVDSFYWRVHNGDLRIKKEAGGINYPDVEEPEGDMSLASNLAYLMSMFRQNRDNEQAHFYAEKTLLWIERAYFNGVIEEGPGLITRLNECQRTKAHLEAEKAKLLSDIEKLSSRVLIQQGRLDQLDKERRMITRVREED